MCSTSPLISALINGCCAKSRIDWPKNGFVFNVILNPLSSFGLWDPVIMIPAKAGVVFTAKYNIGVGPTPMSKIVRPASCNPCVKLACKSGEDNRPSRPKQIKNSPCSRTHVPKRRPTSKASAADKFLPIVPRISYSRKI